MFVTFRYRILYPLGKNFDSRATTNFDDFLDGLRLIINYQEHMNMDKYPEYKIRGYHVECSHDNINWYTVRYVYFNA
jgi:hypothetical protein